MPFDDKQVLSAAAHGDVAVIALHTSIALLHVARAIKAQQKGDEEALKKALSDIEEAAKKLDLFADELTGYTAE